MKNKIFKRKSGLKGLINALYYSYKGLRYAYTEEVSFRIELIVVIILSLLNFYSSFAKIEKIILFISMSMVIITELLNSAIEALVDRVSYEEHALSGKVKDLASAAVFVSIVFSLVCWIYILL
jgi:diacylglycerol kinase (ATP)